MTRRPLHRGAAAVRRAARSLALFAALAAGGCSAAPDEASDTSAGAIREDTTRATQVVTVPVRFTKNEVTDVGVGFTSSWVPFTDVSHEKMDGHSWGMWSKESAEALKPWFSSDSPGAGYATAYFEVEIPYDQSGNLAYSLARVKLDKEFLATQMARTPLKQYSPLRVRAGSDQPCLSITMTGSLDGKLKAVPLPYTDDSFTERDWKVGDTDASGVPITKVILGGLRFSPVCWPEDVQGKTGVSGGVGIPPGGFLMIDKQDGQAGSDAAFIAVNLVENEKGKVSLGAAFSTNAAILGDRRRADFDKAVTAFASQFAADVARGEDDAAKIIEGL